MLLAKLRGWIGARRVRDHALRIELERAVALHEAGDTSGAEAVCRHLLVRYPEQAEVLHLLGLTRLQRGAAGEAAALIRRAIGRAPGRALYHFNLGNALLGSGGPASAEAAAAAFTQTLALDPEHVGALFNLGAVKLELGEVDASQEVFSRLTQKHPDMAAAWSQLTSALYRRAERGRVSADYKACIAAADRALRLPELAESEADALRRMRAYALLALDRVAEALAAFEALRARLPGDVDICVGYANCLGKLGRAQAAFDAYRACCKLRPGNLPLASGTIMAADYVDALSAEDNRALRQRLGADATGPRKPPAPAAKPDPDRTLRIGYLSADLYHHVAMRLFAGVLRAHNAAMFEILVYNASPLRDATTEQLEALAPRWQDVRHTSAPDLAARIAADGVDILVDLSGHTSNNRLDALALQPASVQASWLGYPGSTGLSQVDYLISDPYTSPPESDRYCSERIWRLPATRFCYEPPPESPEPHLAAGPPTFGSFNNLAKLNPSVLNLWREVLTAVPDARLVVKNHQLDIPEAREWFARELGYAGLSAARVELRGRSTHIETLAQYRDVDVALDPFPYCGGLTSFDALWMGVPVITLEQPLIAGRQTLSLLSNLGRDALIARTSEEYVQRAAQLVVDRAQLAHERHALRGAMRASPLCDFTGFTRELEAAYRGMWRTHVAALT